MLKKLIGTATAAGTAIAITMAASPAQSHAAIVTTDLFGHYHNDNALTHGDPNPGPVAGNGDTVYQWLDQALIQGRINMQITSVANAPFLKTNAINGYAAIDLSPPSPEATNPQGLLANSSTTSDPARNGTELRGVMGLSATFTLVVKVDPTMEGSRHILSVGGNVGDGHGVSDHLVTRYENGNRITEVRATDGSMQQIVNSANDVGTHWHVLTVVYDNVAGTLSEYINGELTGTLTGVQNLDVTAEGFDRYRLGSSAAAVASTRIHGEVAELLFYNAALSDQARAANDQFLIDKYAIPEPASLALLGMGATLLLRRRR